MNTIEFGAIPRITHRQSLGQSKGGPESLKHAVADKLQESSWFQEVHRLLVERAVEARREVTTSRPWIIHD